MSRTAVRRSLALCVAVLLCAAPLAADVLKHKETGEVIKGTLTDWKVNGRVVFKPEGGGTKLIDPEAWEVIEKGTPKSVEKTSDKAAETPDSSAPAEKKKTPPRVFVIPIEGPIQHWCMLEALDRAINEARAFKADIVVFRLNTPGGRVDIGNEIIKKIGDIDWATTAAWVEGEDKRALSCGAYICLSTHKIYMMPGSTIGAATPYRVVSGSAAVDEKMQSAFRARFRSLAQERGHPAVIADAMVDNSVSVVEVFVNGKQKLVTADEAKQMAKEYKKDEETEFKVGKTISKPGKLITLTSQEADEFGLCDDIVETEGDLKTTLGDGDQDAMLRKAVWLTNWTEKTAEDRKNEFENARMTFNRYMQQAMTTRVPRLRRKYLKECAAALTKIEKMNGDPKYDLHIPQAMINDLKAQLSAAYNMR